MRVRPIRGLYLYWRFISTQIKAILEYQADFWILVVSAVLTQLMGVVFIAAVFARIPSIDGWGFWEVCFMYAMIYVTEGIGSLFFEGTWRMLRYVNMGELDRFLLRPVSPVLQMLASAVGMNGLGNITLGCALIAVSLRHVRIEWTALTVFWTAVLLLSAVAIRVAINFGSNCSAFWNKSSGNAVPLAVHNVGEFAKFPITVFSHGVQLFVSVAVPFAFVSFYPAAYLFGHEDWTRYAYFGPLAAVYAWAVAYGIYRMGLRRYESTGN
ncbi:ABC transporter permease [Cohnella sp. CFH 77786]|uniref:ABC transporter permease n=1 Tax=Cohnella sp. CFH 77786 TaxID=2662265 RepID=UPI001C60CC71|nr:ABC-2 family transporter protein [Cohnella sp. CFH 77786]MBW5449024.1 ABC transporter permease [Cohnella sp. CFH 77786]